MAGRPKGPFQTAFLLRVETMGGWPSVFERVANGETLTALAAELGVSRSFLSHQLNDDADLRALLSASQEEGAAALIEEALAIARATPADKDAAARDRLKTDVLIRLAGLFNPARFADKHRGPTVEVNIREAHLNAVRRHNALPAPAEPLALPSSGDVEVVDG